MGILTKNNENWLLHNGKKVTIAGNEYRLKVRSYPAIYPYRHTALQVDAEMLDRSHPYYLTIKGILGDDWTTDILGSEIEVQTEVLEQLV